ncbi:MAG: hypothetical protein ABIP55_01050 [Tepidisphaeraceae bacterium]
MLSLLTSLLVVAALGCEKEEAISVYHAPKEAAPEVRAAAQPAANPSNSAAGSADRLHWDVPAGWKESPAKQSMRVATFVVADGNPPVELTVIPLGAEAGALLPNVNRWEGQLGLPQSTQDQLAQIVKSQKVGELDVAIVDLTGPETATPRQRMLAAIAPFGGKIWFFKMSGQVDVIAAQKANFDAFVASLHPGHEGGEAAHAHDHNAHDPNDGGDHTGHDHAKPAAAAPSQLKSWTAPTGWRELPDSKPPRVLAFQMGEGDKTAETVVTRFAATNAGSFLDNVNRWRGQLGLPPIQDPEAVTMKEVTLGGKEGQGGQGIVVEFENPAASPQGGKKMLVLIASAQADLWFVKLTGPSEVVTAQRANFDAFVKSLQFGGSGEATQQPKP